MAVPGSEQNYASAPAVAVRHSRPERLSHARRVWLALEILAAYSQSRRALRSAPIAAVVVGLRRRSPSPAEPPADSLYEARRLGRSVARLLAHLPGDTRCLVRSLVLTRMLAGRGIEAKLVIGARPAPEFLAHAWVEHDGKPVLDPGDESFARMVEL
jgi:transglutaminase superfamily protein